MTPINRKHKEKTSTAKERETLLLGVLHQIGQELNELYNYLDEHAETSEGINKALNGIDDIGTTCDYYEAKAQDKEPIY